MKKRTLSLLLALLLVLTTACGGKGNDTPGNNSAANTQQDGDKQQSSSGSGEVEYTIQWYVDSATIQNGNAARIREKFIAAYPQYDVAVIETDADESQKLTMIAGGEVIDCVWGEPYNAIKGGVAGTYLPLNEYFEKDGADFADLYGELAYKTASHNGVIYGIPKYYNTFKVFYNKTMADAKNITIPTEWTWEEFKATAAALADPDNGVWGVIYPATWSSTVLCEAKILGWNAVVADADGNVTPNFDDERLELVMTAVRDLAEVDKLTPSVSQMRAESINRRAAFATQKAAMFLDGPFTFIWMQNYMFNDPGEGKLDFEVGVTEIPYFEGYDGDKCSYGDVPGLWAIPSTSGNPEAAYRFVRFMENEDAECAAMNAAYLSCYTKWEEQGISYEQLNLDVFNNYTDMYGEKHADVYSPELVKALTTIPKEFVDVYYDFDTRLIPADQQMQGIFDDQYTLFMNGEMEFEQWAEHTNQLGAERLADTNTNKLEG